MGLDRTVVGPRPPRAIAGTTRLFALVGDPVAQASAPELMNPLFARLGLDAVLVPVHARPRDLADVVRGLQRTANLDGLLIAVPHKVEACRFADRLGEAAVLSGSANALRRESDGSWTADNFDGAGFVAGLLAARHPPAGRQAALVGTGGAGAAVAVALLAAGVARLALYDREPARLGALLDRLRERFPGRVCAGADVDLERADLAVNATPPDLCPDSPLPFAPRRLRRGCLVADIVIKPPETPLLRAAAAAGHPVHHGHHMLDHQIPLYRDFFRLDDGARHLFPAVYADS